jgi:hypothetical protein
MFSSVYFMKLGEQTFGVYIFTIIVSCLFEIGSNCVPQAGLELVIEPRLDSELMLLEPQLEITGMSHHTQL